MAGIFGFYAFGNGRENWEAARFIYYGLTALQGRGQETTSIAVVGNDSKLKVAGANKAVETFFEDLGKKTPQGFVGIGQVSSYHDDLIVHVTEPYELALAGDGRTGLANDKAESFQVLAHKLSYALAEDDEDQLQSVTALVRTIPGGYSFLALTHKQELICARDPAGVKPLEVGSVGFDIGAVASESAALDVIGAEHTGEVKPGELVHFDPLSISRKTMESNETQHCSFEYVYLARLDSTLNGVSVSKVREHIGQNLAKENPLQADVVIGVPETALPFASSYSRETGIPNRLGFIRTGKHTRTALKPKQIERLAGVQLKLNPVRDAVNDKDLVLIDDSVVRGNTLRNTVFNLKRKGARRVHVLVGSPAIVEECPFGVEIPPKDELVGRDLSEEEIAEVVGADSFGFLSVDGLSKAIGLPKDRLCMRCFGYKGEEKKNDRPDS